MSGHTSASDAIACVLLAVAIFAGSLVPFFLLVDADRLMPRFVSEVPAAAARAGREAALSAAALLMLLTAPKGATR